MSENNTGSRPTILVTNDDGMFAPGIKALVSIAKEFGEVVVVAPDSPQSGMGHAITIDDPIRLHKVDVFPEIEAWECSGTPVDCVKLAKQVIFNDRPAPDLCVSGINHGSNASLNIIYSGTMSAAMEASLEGINSIGFSLLDYTFDADFEASRPFVAAIISEALKNGLGPARLLNVNIPKLSREEIKGVKVCRQGNARWVEKFQEAVDPRGKKYYWLTGQFENQEEADDTDIWALDNGYISVVPSMHDLTDYKALEPLKSLEKINGPYVT
ncbi:MAG: 5'/3'-nucleotidase SurE [Saprospiraceae bacterium]|nr:5'/3'-nucleotidase SurE [Saprospiraceae bacterium]